MRGTGEKPIFTGAATALITPMKGRGIDLDAFGRIIDIQLASGISALVVCGTTGESATLSDEEKLTLFEFAVNRNAGRVPVIAGTGTNCTEHAVRLTRAANAAGCDAVLVVTPYYNKATQSGLIAHFFDVADASSKPVILYNVPSRTGVCISPETYPALAAHPNIKAIKEASGDISHIAKTSALTRGLLDLYSGNDDQTVPVLSLGGTGVISVVSNVVPERVVRMCGDYLSGRTAAAREEQLELLPLISALFSQVNPIPVKAAMSLMGYCEDSLRLPLTPLEEPMRSQLGELMKQYGLTT